jgi:peptidyl-tRNA hydrolase
MKKENVPQDLSALGKLTKEVCYATDESGQYVTQLSSGWDVKITALDVAWDDIKERVAKARQQVLDNQASPILFFMEYRLMDLKLVADYTGFWQWQIKRHLKPEAFNKLSDKKLQKYAEAFNVAIADLKTMTVHEN